MFACNRLLPATAIWSAVFFALHKDALHFLVIFYIFRIVREVAEPAGSATSRTVPFV